MMRPSSGRVRWWAVAVLLAPGWLACGQDRTQRPLSALLITLDTTRADALGCFGGPAGITPVLDQLAGESLVYDSAFSVAPLTLVSHASMLTGLYPPRHTLRDNGLRALPQSARTLAEDARAAGFQTAAFIAAVVLAGQFGLDQGFDTYDIPSTPAGAATNPYLSRPADEVVEGALQWLRARDRARPFFLWVHLFDPHAPYEPPAAFRERSPTDAYLGEVAAMDHQIGRLLDALRAEGSLDDCLVLVIADHGEGRMQHDEESHGAYCYQTTIQVPMILRHPGGQLAGRRSDAIVSVVDVYPTLAAAMGLQEPRGIDGVSLYRQEPAANRGVYFESYYGYFCYGWSPVSGWADARYKYIHGPTPQLFDLARDPGEVRNLAEEQADQLSDYRRAIEAVAALPELERGQERRIDDAMRAQIQALGYSAMGDEQEEIPHPLAVAGLPDPTQRAWEQIRTNAGQGAYDAREYSKAEGLLREVVASNPRNFKALNLLGLSIAHQDRRADAIEPFRKLVEIGPPRAEYCINLALCLSSTGQVPEALELYRRALEIDPDHVIALGNLIQLLEGIGRPQEAQPFIEHLRALRSRGQD